MRLGVNVEVNVGELVRVDVGVEVNVAVGVRVKVAVDAAGVLVLVGVAEELYPVNSKRT